jgi:hypothetical protein
VLSVLHAAILICRVVSNAIEAVHNAPNHVGTQLV